MFRTSIVTLASIVAVALLAARVSAQTTRPFLAAVDANYALDMERAGKSWRVGGNVVDPFAALASAGFDGFRVRLWTGDDGVNGLPYALESARRAQAAGLKPYLVLFLSEDWADLVKQPVPAIWKDLDLDARARAIETYAERVARRFDDAGIALDTFAIGNEIDFGLCGEFEEAWPNRVSLDYMRTRIWPRMVPMIRAGQRGVRRVKPDARFVVHLAQWNNLDYCLAFWRYMREQGVAVDLAGLSYFPSSATKPEERSLAFIRQQAQSIHKAIGVPVLICESGYPSAANFGGQFAEWNKAADGYPLDPAGQGRWLADYLAMARATPAIAGVTYWSPEWYGGGLWDAFALFDADGNARPALAAMSQSSAPAATGPATRRSSLQPTTVPAAAGVSVYFGNLHAHTAYSDGTGTPAEAFAYARDVARIDFMAITEHNHLLGGAKATPARRRQLYVTDEATALVPAARRFTTDGKFVAIAGQEFSSMSKGNHVNVFDVDEVIDVPNGDFAGLLAWMEANRASDGRPAIVQFNHPALGPPNKGVPANEFGRDDFGDDAAWLKSMGAVTSLIELLNGDPLPGLLKRRAEQMMERHFLLYLQLGFRVAPVGNQDNHKTDWGDSTDARTGLIAPALTKRNVLDAMRDRHVYATEDRNLRVIVRVDGALAGGVVEPTANASIAYEIRDDDEPNARYTIDVFRGTVGGELAAIVKTIEHVGDTPAGTANVIDGVALAGEQYVFVRITQAGEAGPDRAWIAPVWCEAK